MTKAVRRKWERANRLQRRGDGFEASYALVLRHPLVAWTWRNDNLAASKGYPSQTACSIAASLVLDGLDVSELP